MSGEAIAKRIKYIFMLCLFSGLCGLSSTIYASIQAHYFIGIPIFPLLIIATGVMLWWAFRSDSLEKAMSQIGALKIFSLILVVYSVYSIIMVFARTGLGIFRSWLQCVSNFAAVGASLTVFITTITLTSGDIKKFNKASAISLFSSIAVIFSISVALLIVSDMLIPILLGIVVFIFMLGAVPKLLGNSVVKGAIIGSIIAGDVGAVVGAVAASNKEKKK